MERKAIVISGTPGVGKTSLARQLARELGGEHIDLSKFALEKGLTIEVDEGRQSAVVDDERLKKELTEAIKRSTSKVIIVEGHYAEVVPKRYVKCAIVLRLNPKELRNRLLRKGWPESKVDENVKAEILDYCLTKAVEAFGTDLVREIDASGVDEAKLLELALQAICDSNGRFSPGRVDWISALEKDGALESYLFK